MAPRVIPVKLAYNVLKASFSSINCIRIRMTQRLIVVAFVESTSLYLNAFGDNNFSFSSSSTTELKICPAVIIRKLCKAIYINISSFYLKEFLIDLQRRRFKPKDSISRDRLRSDPFYIQDGKL